MENYEDYTFLWLLFSLVNDPMWDPIWDPEIPSPIYLGQQHSFPDWMQNLSIENDLSYDPPFLHKSKIVDEADWD